MRKYSVKKEGTKFLILLNDQNNSEIIFDENNIEATLKSDNKTLRAEKGLKGNIEIKESNETLFTLKFDFIWGGAEIIANGVDTGLDIKGKFFKPGTRLTDANNEDLVVVVKKNDGLEVIVNDDKIDPTMLITTIYYHIYASRSLMTSLIASV